MLRLRRQDAARSIKNTVGLGRAILNRRAKEAKQRNQTEFHTTDINNYGSVSNLRSVTHEGDLEEFLTLPR